MEEKTIVGMKLYMIFVVGRVTVIKYYIVVKMLSR